mgnify:CR=1 FL=1
MNIKELIHNNSLFIKDEKTREKVKALSLYKILNMPYFKGTYKTINIAETSLKELPFLLVTDSMNKISGFANKNVNKMTASLIKKDEYEAQFVESNDFNRIYVNKEKFDALKRFSKVLINSGNIEEFINNIQREHSNNANFLHNCYNLTNRGRYNNFSLVFKLIESTIHLGKIESKDLKSVIYTQDIKNKKSLFSSVTNKFDEEEVYNQLLGRTSLSNLIDENDKIGYIVKNNLFQDKFNEKEITEKIVKKYIKDNSNDFLSIFIIEKNQEKRVKAIINSQWGKVRDNFSYLLKKDLSKFLLVEDEIEENKENINKILETIDLKKQQKPANIDDIEYYIVDTKNNKSLQYQQILVEEKEYIKNFNIFQSKDFGLKLIDYEKDGSMQRFFYDTELPLFPYDNYNAAYDGLCFVNNDLFERSGKNTYIVAKNKGETIGFLSVSSSSSKECVKKIGNISVKYNHRGLNIPKMLYDKLAKISIKKGWIVTNTMYTESGKKSLPEVKESTREENPKFLMIDASYKVSKTSHCSDILENFNSYVINYIENLEEKDISLKEIRESYKNKVEEILNLTQKDVENYKYNYDKNVIFFNSFVESIKTKKIKLGVK